MPETIVLGVMFLVTPYFQFTSFIVPPHLNISHSLQSDPTLTQLNIHSGPTDVHNRYKSAWIAQ